MRRALHLALLSLAVIGLVWLSRSASRGPGTTVGSAAAEAAADEPVEAEPDRPARAPGEDAALEQREPVEAEPEAPRTARFAGRLIDAETGEAVPWYELVLRDREGQVVRVTSDGEGRFEASGDLAPGPIRIELVDFEGQPRPSEGRRWSVTVEHAGGPPSEVRIDVGPTYLVDFAPDAALPDGLVPAGMRVRLLRDPPELSAEHVDEETSATVLRAPSGDSPYPWARLRQTNRVRRKPQWLEVSSADGLRMGGARVPSGPGVHRDPVRVTLASACAVRGRYVSDARHRAALALFREGAQPEPRWEFTDREGRFRISGLTPGTYRIEVRDEAVRAAPVTFALRAGELDLGELPWTPIPLAGSVRLRVQSEVEIPIDVQLVRRFDAPRYPRWHSDDWQPIPGGGFESRFAWDEVHAGAFEIVVHSHHLGEWSLSLGELEPPVEDLLVRLPAPRPALALTVVDDETGVALDEWTVIVRGGRGWDEPDGGSKTLPFVVWDEDTAFAVCSPGYRAWVASPADPGFPATADGRVVARLRPGWSHLFLARRRSRGSALADVEIRLDGLPVGRTDARGELWVHAEARAQELEVAHPTLVWTDEDEAWLDDPVSWLALHP